MFWKKNSAPANPSHDDAPARAPETPRTDSVQPNAAPAEPARSTPVAAAPQPGEAQPSAQPGASGAPDATASPREEIASGLLREQIIGQLRTVYDPEIPVNIYELGLVYKVQVDEEHNVLIEMTLTSPACPSAEEIPVDVRRKAEAVEGVKSVDVRIVWEPPWTQEFMSDVAKVQLGFF